MSFTLVCILFLNTFINQLINHSIHSKIFTPEQYGYEVLPSFSGWENHSWRIVPNNGIRNGGTTWNKKGTIMIPNPSR